MKTKPKPSNKALAYLRVSTDRQDMSMQDQEEKIKAYCTIKGFELVEVLREPDVSGKTKLYDRPEGSKIKELLSSNKVSHVVSLKLDRLFRNAGDALTVSEEWLTKNVSLHLVDMSGSAVDTGSPQGRMFFTMLAGFAEFERGLISERTTSALRFRKNNGRVYCGKLPYGFRSDAGDLFEDAAEMAAIGKMRELRAEGMPLRQIGKELDSQGIKTKDGLRWHPFTIHRILTSAR
jgi:site-specific DNA recombinase